MPYNHPERGYNRGMQSVSHRCHTKNDEVKNGRAAVFLRKGSCPPD